MKLYHASEVFCILAQKPRRGWVMRGIADPETTYEHSVDMAEMARVYAPEVSSSLDPNYCAELCMNHDISDFSVPDITPHEKITPRRKRELEHSGIWHLRDTVIDTLIVDQILLMWREVERKKTHEAQLVHQLDRLQLAKQTLIYEQTQDKNMPYMWDYAQEILTFPPLIEAFNELKQQRPSDIDKREITVVHKLSPDDDLAAIKQSIERLTPEKREQIIAERNAAFEHYPLRSDLRSKAQLMLWNAPLVGRRLYTNSLF